MFAVFFLYLDHHKPLGWIVEEVMGFLDVDPVSSMSYFELFLQEAATRGYECRAVILNADIWAQVNRPRLNIAVWARSWAARAPPTRLSAASTTSSPTGRCSH